MAERTGEPRPQLAVPSCHPSLGEQRSFWNSWNSEYRENRALDLASVRRREAVLGLLQSLPLNQPRILEVGCGSGWLSEKLVQLGRVTAVDLADEVIARARHRAPQVTFLAGDFLKLGLDENSFDVVISIETIAYVPNQAEFVRRCADVLKDNGWLILTTVNKFVFERRTDVAVKGAGQIRQWLDRRTLRRLLQTRFSLLKERTIFPAGDKGILRFVNSYKLNTLLSLICPSNVLERIKEWLGLGQTIVVLAVKRSSVGRA